MKAFSRALSSVVEVGREILARRMPTLHSGASPAVELTGLCQELLEHRGEASGLALASEIAQAYQQLDSGEKALFFDSLLQDFGVDDEAIFAATERYRKAPDPEHLAAIGRVVEASRLKLFRRLNMAADGTRILVGMRGELQALLRDRPELRAVDADLRHLFVSWFNKGFLEMQQISWDTPASVLEKIIEYEAVHAINGWDDLRNRLRKDRACFGFFHPAMPGDPLVFVEVAFTGALPDAIAPLLEQQRERVDPANMDTVVFYSISNCHRGLAGISFGNFLIKQVVEEVREEHPGINTFVTLSPVPGFCRWLQSARLDDLIDESLHQVVREPVGQVVATEVRDALIKLCAHYLLEQKSGRLALDPVARFHLGNGARLHRLHWAADLSEKGKQQSAGIMVNYLYDLKHIEINHEEYFDQGLIAASRTISRLL
ncbi:MAG: malonyl-CoA decarboxylase [Halieaceae bacterium]